MGGRRASPRLTKLIFAPCSISSCECSSLVERRSLTSRFDLIELKGSVVSHGLRWRSWTWRWVVWAWHALLVGKFLLRAWWPRSISGIIAISYAHWCP